RLAGRGAPGFIPCPTGRRLAVSAATLKRTPVLQGKALALGAVSPLSFAAPAARLGLCRHESVTVRGEIMAVSKSWLGKDVTLCAALPHERQRWEPASFPR